MKIFELYRTEDATGVSGTGIVAQGIQFDNGKCAMSWIGELSSVGIYNTIEDLEKIHGHGGKTQIKWIQSPLYIGDET